MRISSRGTVYGGPVFWVLASPFILVGLLAWALLRLAVLAAAAIARHRAVRRA